MQQFFVVTTLLIALVLVMGAMWQWRSSPAGSETRTLATAQGANALGLILIMSGLLFDLPSPWDTAPPIMAMVFIAYSVKVHVGMKRRR